MSARRPASGLLASAQEFLAESLRNLSDHRPHFAIVHAVTATELVLKERLSRLNPALIHKNIDTRAPDKEQTVSLSVLPLRLANLGLPLSATHAQLIAVMAEWRNQIVHHMPSYDARAAQRQLPQLLDFLADFLRTQLGTPLETFLPKALYKVAHRQLADWQKAVKSAQSSAAHEGGVLPDTCPRCGSAAVMCLRAEDAVHCHLCGTAFYRCESCDGCGRRTVTSYKPDLGYEDHNFCDECIDAAGDEYLSRRG